MQEQLAATSLSGDEQHSAALVKRLQRVQSMLVAEEAMIYKSAAIFGAIVADLAGNDMAAREALLSPPASGTCDVKAVTHFDCLGSTVESYERACGVFSDYSLQYAGVLQVCRGVLQCAVVCCSMLQSFSRDYSLQYAGMLQVCCGVLQCAVGCVYCVAVYFQGLLVAVCRPVAGLLQVVIGCYSVLQCVAVCCSVLLCILNDYSLQYASILQVCCSMLQYICSVLPCVAVCCSVLQCVFSEVSWCVANVSL